jgi:hypothetical protein
MRARAVVVAALCASLAGVTSASAERTERSTAAATCAAARASHKAASQPKSRRVARRRARAARVATLRRCRPARAAAPELSSLPGGVPTRPVAPGPAEPVTQAPTAETLGHSVQVRAREYSLSLSRSVVAAGDVSVELQTVNAEDPHDLNVRDAKGAQRPLFEETPAGLVPPPRQAFAFAPGDYVLFCSLPGHEALGMQATLRVR